MWIITAWKHILSEVTVMDFKKCCIPNSLDETGDNILWNGGNEEDGNIRSLCEESDIFCVLCV